MKIKSLLLGSTAALIAVSGARAADAVVIPEPETVEYVRVCDAAGTGYFYIPGTETCLKIGGYVQYQISTGSGELEDDNGTPFDASDDPDVELTDGWNKAMEARLTIDSYTDSEYGAVKTSIRLTSGDTIAAVDTDDQGEPNALGISKVFVIDRAHMTIGGLNIGLNESLYDFSETGAADDLVGNGYTENQISYSADFGNATFAVQLVSDAEYNYVPDVIGKFTYGIGEIEVAGAIVYSDADEDVGAKVTASYGGFGAVFQYSGQDLGSDYAGSNQFVLGANYGFDATEKLNLNVGGVYGFEDDYFGEANWIIGAEAEYAMTDTFTVSARARAMNDEDWDARIRFKSSF